MQDRSRIQNIAGALSRAVVAAAPNVEFVHIDDIPFLIVPDERRLIFDPGVAAHANRRGPGHLLSWQGLCDPRSEPTQTRQRA